MLINLDTKLNGSVTVKLTFDDDTVKEQIIKRGMKLGLTYRDNNTKHTKIGIVKCIKILSTACQDGHRKHKEVDWFECKKPKFVFVMDFSKEYKSDIVEVPDVNIVDIALLQSDDKMELLNMFNTCKETINNDENQYTEESWQYYSSVLDIIKTAILDDPSKNATHASAGINILNNAIMNLVPVEEPETPVEEPETPPAEDTPTEDQDEPVEEPETPSTEEPEKHPVEDPGKSEDAPSDTPTEDPETPAEEPETPSTEEGETENENLVEQETPVVDESVNSTVEEDLNGDNQETETRS